MAQTLRIRRFLVQAVADCTECDGKGQLDSQSGSEYLTPDFGNNGQIVYKCTKCRGSGEIKLTVDLEEALKSIKESNA